MGAYMGVYGKREGEDLTGNGGKSAGKGGRGMAKKIRGGEEAGDMNK